MREVARSSLASALLPHHSPFTTHLSNFSKYVRGSAFVPHSRRLTASQQPSIKLGAVAAIAEVADTRRTCTCIVRLLLLPNFCTFLLLHSDQTATPAATTPTGVYVAPRWGGGKPLCIRYASVKVAARGTAWRDYGFRSDTPSFFRL